MGLRGAWAEVDLAALRANLAAIRARIAGGARLCAVVKADGYGHGAVAVAREAVAAGASYLAVAVVSEGIALRRAGFTTPILLLGPTAPAEAATVAAYDLTAAVFTREAAALLNEAALRQHRRVRVHLAVDTGMGRIGTAPEAAADLAAWLKEQPGLELEGMFSHFALADAADKGYAREQFRRFEAAMAAVKGRGIPIPLCHIANSAAILELPETHLDMVRAGIILYGLWPSPEVRRSFALRPLMAVKARLSYVKEVAAGTPIGYGCTFVAPQVMRVATLPLGYADGYSRLYAGKAAVELHGRRAPVVGRICMDQCMIDVTAVPEAAAGDAVTIFGAPTLTAEEAAAWLGTISYEVVCMIAPRVPRVYRG